MKKYFLICCVFFLGCGKDAPPSPPGPISLVFPTQNLDCTQGSLINEVTRRIAFEWREASEAESYRLEIVQLSSGQKTTQNTLMTTIEVPLRIGEAYSWQVIASNTKVLETTPSALWYFFNAGSETTHAPFPATALTPLSRAQITMPAEVQVSLRWSGSEIDNDIVSYTLLLDNQSPPSTNRSLSGATATQFTANVVQGATYYWQVVTTDDSGNSTPSAVFDFKID
jgi:hypothetical protein